MNMKFTKRKTFLCVYTIAALCLCLCTTTLSAQQLVNLLNNPGMNTDHSGWTFVNNNNDGFPAVFTTDQGYGGTGGLLTGYIAQVSQEIDLLAIGYSEAFLDGAPIVRFADWFKGTGTDVADQYRFFIELRDADGTVIDSYASDWYIGTADFQQVKHNFINYGSGLRSIYIMREGWDAEYDQNANLGIVMDATHLSIGNLLLNASAQTGDLSGWTINSNGGDGWTTQNWCEGCAPAYQTSFEMCSKSQTVDLMELGYTEAALDMQPCVNIIEWYLGFDGPGNGSGFGDSHFLNVELRDGSGNVLESFSTGNQICTDTWQNASHTFSNYGTGLREIYVEHGGIDTEYWTGHYGGFIDATQMTIDFNTPDASFAYTATSYCVDDSNPVATVTGLAGGTFSATAGLSIDPTSGLIDLSASTAGTYAVTYTTPGTCVSSSTTEVTINEEVNNSTSLNGLTIISNATGATYQWLDCDNGMAMIPGETNNSYTPSMNGNYAVAVTQNGCTKTSDCVLIATVGVRDNSFSGSFIVYPNPSSAKAPITMELNNEENGTYQVEFVNLLGQAVFQTQVEKNSNDFKTSFNLPSDINTGVYMINIRKDDAFATRRIMIK